MDEIKNCEEKDSQNSIPETSSQLYYNTQISFSPEKSKYIYKKLTLLIIFLTLSLWFTERYLRFTLTETKYRIAVSLEAESARPILRSIASELVTNLKEHTNSTQYLQYLEFLASIEEGEEVLKLYETLYPYNNQNSQFLINLGCRAYLNGNYEKAQKIFSEAGNLFPYNSLPTYLLSSSIFKISQTNENLDKVISYLARENRNNHPIIFPKPFWHNSLPTLCYAYYLRKKEIYERTTSPIYELCYSITNYLTSVESEKIKISPYKIKTAIEELYLMGDKFLKNSELNDPYLKSNIVLLALTIQRHALSFYENTREKIKIKSDLLENKIDKLNLMFKDISILSNFELEREKTFEKTKNYQFLLLLTIFISVIEILIFYVFLKVLNNYFTKNISTASSTQNIIQSLVLIWSLTITLILILLSPQNLNLIFSKYSFNAFIKFCLILNFITPIILSLVSSIVTNQLPQDQPTTKNFFSLLVFNIKETLFYQICFGIISICLWFIVFRLMYFAYPYQVNLIPDILSEKEISILQSIITHY